MFSVGDCCPLVILPSRVYLMCLPLTWCQFVFTPLSLLFPCVVVFPVFVCFWDLCLFCLTLLGLFASLLIDYLCIELFFESSSCLKVVLLSPFSCVLCNYINLNPMEFCCSILHKCQHITQSIWVYTLCSANVNWQHKPKNNSFCHQKLQNNITEIAFK